MSEVKVGDRVILIERYVTPAPDGLLDLTGEAGEVEKTYRRDMSVDGGPVSSVDVVFDMDKKRSFNIRVSKLHVLPKVSR